MKVSEILLEATPVLKKMPNGWAWVMPNGQTYGGFTDVKLAQDWAKKNSQLLGGPATPSSATTSQPAASSTKEKSPAAAHKEKVRAGEMNNKIGYVKGRGFVIFDEKGKAIPGDKKAAVKAAGPNAASKIKSLETKFIQGFYKSKWVKFLGRNLAIWTPIMTWFEDMAEINVLFDEGFFNNTLDANGNLMKVNNQVAGQHAAEARSRATNIAVQKIVTELAALAVILKTSPKLVLGLRALLAGIPGAGWIAMAGVTAVQAAIIAMLTSESMQTKIANWIMNDITTGMADVIGNTVGSMDATTSVGAYINTKKAEILGTSNQETNPAP